MPRSSGSSQGRQFYTGEPTAERGGRAKRHFEIEAAGRRPSMRPKRAQNMSKASAAAGSAVSRSTLAVSQWILARLMPPAQADA
jgi:hypothetical protein